MKFKAALAALLLSAAPSLALAQFDQNSGLPLTPSDISVPAVAAPVPAGKTVKAAARPLTHVFNVSRGKLLVQTSWTTDPETGGDVLRGHAAFQPTAGKPCSPYFRDSWANPDESQDGANYGGAAGEASLADYPFGWDSFETISLETCARCVDTGEFLGCSTWGGTWPATGDKQLLDVLSAEAPPATYLEALKLFTAFYSPR